MRSNAAILAAVGCLAALVHGPAARAYPFRAVSPVPVVRTPMDTDGNEAAEMERQQQYFDTWTGGALDPAALHAMWNEVLALPSEPPVSAPAPSGGATTTTLNAWELVGPLYQVNAGSGYMTGRVRDIEARTTRVLAASGGLWRFNFGPIPMSESVPSTWFGSFATDPTNDNTIVLGTGEYTQGAGTGIYKTIDGGATWAHKITTPEPGTVMRVRWSTGGLTLHAATSTGYYRSTDRGETWARTAVGVFTDLCTVNTYENLLYATQANTGLWRTTDGGLTWTQFTTGGIPFTGTGKGSVATILPSRLGAVEIYVAFSGAGVWRSIDGGINWTNITPSPAIGTTGYGPVITVCPSAPNTVLVGDVGVQRTTDGGTTWTPLVTSQLHADYHVFSWDADGMGVWAGHDGGWSHSTDRGLTWDTSANVMPVTQFYNIACERNETGYMIGGSQDNGISYTPDEALFWTNRAAADGAGACIDPYNTARMWALDGEYGGSYTYHRMRTVDGGATWNEDDTGIDPNTEPGEIRTDNAFNPWLVTSAGPYVYDSTDLGLTWTKSNATAFPYRVTELTSTTRVSPTAVVYACVASSAPGQRLYVRDGGAWYERSAGLPAGTTVRKVVPHPWSGNYANEAWALMNGVSPPGQKLYHTTNRGLTWSNITGDLPNVPLGDLIPDPYDTSQLFLGTMLGCFRSTNGGTHWERWNNGLTPAVMVTEMAYIDLTPSSGPFYVVAGTYGRSVWKRQITGSDPVSVSEPGPRQDGLRMDLARNPVSSRAALQFTLPGAGEARLEVFDIRGRRAATVLDAVLPRGPHTQSFDTGGFAPGVYFCRLECGKQSAMLRMVITH